MAIRLFLTILSVCVVGFIVGCAAKAPAPEKMARAQYELDRRVGLDLLIPGKADEKLAEALKAAGISKAEYEAGCEKIKADPNYAWEVWNERGKFYGGVGITDPLGLSRKGE